MKHDKKQQCQKCRKNHPFYKHFLQTFRSKSKLLFFNFRASIHSGLAMNGLLSVYVIRVVCHKTKERFIILYLRVCHNVQHLIKGKSPLSDTCSVSKQKSTNFSAVKQIFTFVNTKYNKIACFYQKGHFQIHS